MSYSDGHSFLDTFGRMYQELRRSPMFLAIIIALYSTFAVFSLMYLRLQRNTVALQEELARQNQRLVAAETERQSLATRDLGSRANVDVFRRLSFIENVSLDDRPKLQAAQSLNAFAKYALDNRDFQKARDTLDESLRTFGTTEGQYYLGVTAYLQGRYDEAIAVWAAVAKAPNSQPDVLLYLSLAEYRLGNMDDARKYADSFARAPLR